MTEKIIDRNQAVENLIQEGVTFIKEKSTNTLYRLKQEIDNYADSNDIAEEIGDNIYSKYGHWNIAFDAKHTLDSGYDLKEKYEELANDEDIVVKWIYMYEHSGQSISLTPYNDPWDSGICGLIYVTREQIGQLYGDCGAYWRAKADQWIEEAIEEYNCYITGDVYRYFLQRADQIEHKNLRTGETWIEADYETVESVSNFLSYNPEKSGLLEDALSNLDKEIEFFEISF